MTAIVIIYNYYFIIIILNCIQIRGLEMKVNK